MTSQNTLNERVINALNEMKGYLEECMSDKYCDTSTFTTADILLSPHLGKGANCFTAAKYVQRYSTEGYKKSGKRIDLKKAIHYLLFEMARRDELGIDDVPNYIKELAASPSPEEE